jgi:RimJ/RimL family protein N-acetyltransferase
MNYDDLLALMALHVETLYRFDTAGRMLSDNEPDGAEAPRFYMHRTQAGHTWRFGHTIPNTTQQRISALCAAEPNATDLTALPTQYDAIRTVLAEDALITREYRGPAYCFEHSPQPGADTMLIDSNSQQLLRRYFPYHTYSPNTGPIAVAIADGVAVSCCFCSRLAPHAAHAGLETAESYRRRGYAVAAVATWAARVFATGRQPFYSTTWDNRASQGVAQHFGLRLFGEDWHIA